MRTVAWFREQTERMRLVEEEEAREEFERQEEARIQAERAMEVCVQGSPSLHLCMHGVSTVVCGLQDARRREEAARERKKKDAATEALEAKLKALHGAPTLELARANSGFGARQVPHSSSSFAPFMHSLSLLGISRYHASKATQEGQGEEGDSHRPHVCPSPSPRCTT